MVVFLVESDWWAISNTIDDDTFPFTTFCFYGVGMETANILTRFEKCGLIDLFDSPFSPTNTHQWIIPTYKQ